MISTWRRRAGLGESNKLKQQQQPPDMELAIPTHFLCPISLQLMKDPVILSSGITYDRDSIDEWLQNGNYTCPVTSQILRSFDQVPNQAIRKMIQDWCVDNRQYGVERIPTPKVPVTPFEVSEILSRITASTLQGDQNQCLQMLHTIDKLSAEGERNRQCILANGTAGVLAASFDAFASSSVEENTTLLEHILSTINWMFPLGVEAHIYLGSPASLLCMVCFLNSGDLLRTQNAILALKELLSIDQQYSEALVQIEGVIQLLIKLIKQPICSTVTKSVLSVIFYMLSSSSASNDKVQSTLVEMGLASLLLEILVDSERSICEGALGVFDRLCDCEEGREKAFNNALTMPVLVKKVLRVSELATEFSVSAIWKLCRYEKREERSALVEALQVGAFQKLLLVLQDVLSALIPFMICQKSRS
ncbi:hypothetical protein F0562_025370 [Nyssa sinensis]|uniref:U-box domain-containing protein n=1 Tax=Nyssa sinensis TaxID=561372 RepID=A0A5J5BHY9_9ASTE|nr:hypothetical protein F0562_025370 [Nyssa sinensis]